MSKFSVKKPLTIFVAVIAILVLGIVAYTKMTPDLFPNMDFPYVMIVTTYPGASPEKVEEELTKPMEQSLSTLEHIQEVSSTSSENYSLVLLEFDEDVNMDTIGVDIQQKITALSESWDDLIGAPYVLKINPSMIPVEVAAVSMDGMDTTELTELLNDELLGKLEGISGVAQVTTSGTVEQQIHVVLDQAKIDAKNQTIADAINGKMDEAAQELTQKQEELQEAQEQLSGAQAQLDSGKNALAMQTAAGEAQLNQKQTELLSTRAELQDQITQLQSGKLQIQTALTALTALRDGIETLQAQANAIYQDIDTMLRLQETGAELQALRDSFEERISQIQSDTNLTPEEIEAAIAEIRNSPEYLQMEAALAQLQAQLAGYGLDLSTIQNRIAESRAAYDDLQRRIAELEGSLSDQGLSMDSLDGQIAELESNLAQMDEGVAALESAIEQLDSGMLQLQDAAKLLSQQKTSGLIELGSAAAQLAVNSATVDSALTQIESGLDTIESSRQDALDQAELGGILTMNMVSSILTAQNFSMPAGYIEQDGVSYMVSVGDEMTTAEELEGLLLFDLGMDGVEPIYLGDVTAILVTDNSAESYSKLNGQDGIVLSFEKQSAYATAETTNNIADRFAELEEAYPGLHFVSLMNQGSYIYLIVDTILHSLLLGAIFAIVILFLFLKDLRPTFITLCAIPISLVFAIVLMYFSGVTINMISLSGLAVAVGMLVDNSVVVIENIYRLRSKGANVIQAAVSGAEQVAGAVIASTLTTVCVFLPIVFVEGITKQLFTDLALTMSYALLASLIVSLTLVPAMASGLLRKEKQTKDLLLGKLLSGYRKAAAWSLSHKPVVLGAALALLVVSGVVCASKGFAFMPEADMPNVSISITMPEDADMETAGALADEVLARIDTLDGIETVGAMMSSGGSMSILSGSGGDYDVTIYITLSDENASGSEVGDEIVALCADLPCEVSASSSMMSMSMLTGSGIGLQIYSEDMEALQNAAREAANVLSGIAGTTEVSNGLEDAAPALHIRVDRNEAMAKGMTVAQIYMELAAALQDSATATTLELDGNTTEVIVESPESARITLPELADYTFEVTDQQGETVAFRLGDIAEIEETTSLSAIQRLNQRRYLTVSASIEAGYNVTLVTRQAERAMAKANLGSGVTYEFSGESETIMEAIEQLLLMLVLGVLLVYLVMVAQFQSLKSPFIVMFTIPLAFTGGFLALLICGMEISVVSLIGFVMLTGIIVNNGIVLVDYINQLRQDGMERREAIIEAGATRMRPILMTSITTILGLIDMALSSSAGTALMQPVAVVCIGGLVYATLMTLFVVPCIYDMLNKKELRKVRDEDLVLLDL